jgi:hypothetical protein
VSVFFLNIKKLKKVSDQGANLLLLDLTELNTFLKSIPNLHKDLKEDSDQILRFQKLLKTQTLKIELFLKVLATSSDLVVSQYKNLIQKKSIDELQLILELKGLSKLEVSNLLSTYKD